MADKHPNTEQLAAAQRDAALDLLERLVRYTRRIGGYMSTEDQHALWQAQALLAEAGRKP